MNTEAEVGQSCEDKGDVNSKLTAPSYHLFSYTGTDVLRVWPVVEPMLEKAAQWSRGEFRAEDALNMLLARKMILWVFALESEIHLSVLTEVRDYPRQRVCNIYAVAGRNMVRVWQFAKPFARKWLEENRIDAIQATCRDAVMRKMLPLGFRKTANVLNLDWREAL